MTKLHPIPLPFCKLLFALKPAFLIGGLIQIALLNLALSSYSHADSIEPTNTNISALAKNSSIATGPHIEVELISEYPTLNNSAVNWIGVKFSPEKDWHTYWRNPGDSGEAPTIEWQLTTKSGHSIHHSVGEILWPIPTPIKVAHLVNYGYEGTNLLMVPLTVTPPPNKTEQIEVILKASVSWLVCKEDCIPGWADLELPLTVITSEASEHDSQEVSLQANNLFESTRNMLPKETHLLSKYEVIENHISFEVNLDSKILKRLDQDKLMLLPIEADVIKHNANQLFIPQHLSTHSNLNASLVSTISKSEYFIETGEPLTALLTDGDIGYYVESISNTSVTAKSRSNTSLIALMIMAFAGGLILNIMPCVLPVLSFKALALSQDAPRSNISRIANWGYPIGVLISFNLFALIITVIKQGGESIGWGFHMQEPLVIASLAFLFLFIALMLMDLTPNGSGISGLGQSLIQGNGFSSQFFTGVLAVVVASPCTAPFMAAALGVALVSDPVVTFVLFSSLAIGFALPLTLISILPAAKALIPKPGPWMTHFKHFLVFPMIGTVIWLVWVFLAQSGPASLLALLFGLLMFALLFWVSSITSRRLSNSFALLALVVAVTMIARFSKPSTTPNSSDDNSNEFAQAYNASLLQQLREQNQIVLVNMTADWCITCKVNEHVAFSSEEFTRLFEAPDIHYLVGDWTNKNSEILKFLNQYNRSGVPLYVLYAGSKEVVLPQILTTNLVVEAINNAREDIKNETI